MSVAEIDGIKHSLIDWINQLSDTELISFLNGIRISREKKDWWDELSPAQQSHLLAGLKDADNGNIISSELFWEKINNA